MRCPFCQKDNDHVIDSRSAEDGKSIRRRRECLECGNRFTTYEALEKTVLFVIKKDGRRELFDREKIFRGISRACVKRNIPMEKIKSLTDTLEIKLRSKMQREIASEEIGELVMETLSSFDEVAYVRFASVYKNFSDIKMFKDLLESLLEKNKD